jgi:hypothetical protein
VNLHLKPAGYLRELESLLPSDTPAVGDDQFGEAVIGHIEPDDRSRNEPLSAIFWARGIKTSFLGPAEAADIRNTPAPL